METTDTTVKKYADAPIVKYASATRDNQNKFSITGLSSTNAIGTSSGNDTIYYLVKEAEEDAPSVDDVINANNAHTSTTLTKTIEGGVADKAYVVYLVAKTYSGTVSASVLPVKIAKSTAKKINPVTDLKLETGTEATYSWQYNEEENTGLVEYKALLKKSNTILDEKIVKKGETKEANFFDTLKKQSAGIYTIEVTAVADNVDYQNSTSQSTNYTLASVTASVTIKDFNASNPTLLKWEPATSTNTADIKNYTVKVAKYDKSKSGNEYSDIIASKEVADTECDIADLVKDYGAGTYAFIVTANPQDNILKASVSSASLTTGSANNKYHQGEGIKDLKKDKVEGNKVTLTATLLDEDNVFDSLSSNPSYTIYYRKATEKNYIGNGADFTLNEGNEEYTTSNSLEYGTEYYFIVKTTVDNKDYYSNEVSAQTEVTPITTTNEVSYVPYVETSPIDKTPKFNNTNQITYNDGILYIRNTSSTVESYSSDKYPEIETIIAVLNQLGNNDKIKIEDNVITKLTLNTSSVTNDKTYDLSDKVSKDAIVDVTGHKAYSTIIKGALNEVTLKGTTPKFDLSGLTAQKVDVSVTDSTLAVADNAKLTFTGTSKKATINNVTLETAGKNLGTVTLLEGGFVLDGDDTNQLTVDSSKATKVIDLTFTSKAQATLDVTADSVYGIRLFTNTMPISTLTVNKGKVDITNADIKTFTVGSSSAKADDQVILVTSGKAKASINDGAIDNVTGTTIEGLDIKLKASEASAATYTTVKDSGELTITFIKEGKTVTISNVE